MIDIILKLRDKKVFKILIPTVLLLANLHMIYLHGRNIKQKGINEDVNMVLLPARRVIESGSLENVGLGLAKQAVNLSNFENLTFPYFFSSIGPTISFIPIVFFANSPDVTPFFIGQVGFLILFLSIILVLFRKDKITIITLFLLLLLFTAISNSILSAASQLQFYILLVVFWKYRFKVYQSTILGPVFISTMVVFRSESIVLLIGYIIYYLLYKYPLKKIISNSITTFFSFFVVQGLFSLSVKLLGGLPSSDHISYLLGYRVLEPGWSYAFSTAPTDFGLFLEPINITNMFKKIVFHFQESKFYYRDEIYFLYLTVVVFLFSRKSKKIIFDFLILLIFVFFSTLIFYIGVNASRYYESIYILCFLYLITNLKSIDFSNFNYKRNLLFLGCIIFVFICRNPIASFKKQYRNILYYSSSGEKNRVLFANEIKPLIPRDARVVSRHSEYWTWYCGGTMALTVLNKLEINKEIMSAYNPEALIYFSWGNKPLPNSASGLKNVKTVLFESTEGYPQIGCYYNDN